MFFRIWVSGPLGFSYQLPFFVSTFVLVTEVCNKRALKKGTIAAEHWNWFDNWLSRIVTLSLSNQYNPEIGSTFQQMLLDYDMGHNRM